MSSREEGGAYQKGQVEISLKCGGSEEARRRKEVGKCVRIDFNEEEQKKECLLFSLSLMTKLLSFVKLIKSSDYTDSGFTEKCCYIHKPASFLTFDLFVFFVSRRLISYKPESIFSCSLKGLLES